MLPVCFVTYFAVIAELNATMILALYWTLFTAGKKSGEKAFCS